MEINKNSMTPEKARQNVIDSFDLSEALNLISEESKKGKLYCVFKKGDSTTLFSESIASKYINGLEAMGYQVIQRDRYEIEIQWSIK